MSRCVRGWGLGWRVYPPWGYSAHTGRILGRHKNGKYAAVTRGRPAFRQHEAHAEGSDTTPHIEVPKKCKTGVFITSHSRAPAETQRGGFGGKRMSDRESESCRLRRDKRFVVRSDDSQHRICLVCGEAAALPNAPSGQSPAPKFRAEARTHLMLRLEKNMKKDIKFSTRMASADREKIRALAAKAHMSMSDYVTACCLGKRIVVIDEQKELLRQLKGIGSNINRLTVLANMGKVQVIALKKAAGELSEVSAALRAVMEGR